MANKALVYAIYPNENRNEQEQNKSKILLDKILKVYYNRRHNACPHITDIIYMNFSERRRRKEVTFIDGFQRVTGWWEVMRQIASEYIPESHTE